MKHTFQLLFLLCFIPSIVNADQQAGVAMPDQYSAEVSAQVLRDGGNAVDAAIAAAFTLAVTLPEAGNIGGGGFMLVYKDNKAEFLDYREKAPQKASRDMYLDKNGKVIPYMSLLGGHSIGVPGTVQGMWQAHQKHATLSWQRLLEPAIKLAKEGFIVHPKLMSKIKRYSNWIKNKGFKVNFNEYFLGAQSGEIFKQPELAQTLTRISKHGAKEFYLGETADLFVAQMNQSDGIISHKDLASYKAIWRQPVKSNWQGYEVYSAPPPSSGGIAVIQLLKMKEHLSNVFQNVKHNSAQYIHLLAEMEKRVYADRATHLGDPDFYDVPSKQLVKQEYIEQRANQINTKRVSKTESIKPGAKESEDTTHFSIIDRWGNAVSNTYTLNISFGSGVVVKGAGFLLNDEMDDFSAKPGVPNIFGVVGNKANEISPNKRMLSSMSPTILIKDGKPRMVVGSPGGSTIITSVFQTIINHIDFKMTPEQSVNSMRVHHQLLPKDQVTHSEPLNWVLRQDLINRGYNLKKRKLGDVHLVTLKDNKVEAASDKNGRGKSIVVNHKASQGEVTQQQAN